MKIEAFWDASAIVPLCVNQPPYSSVSRKLLQKYAFNVWWGTGVEVNSALTRLKRSGFITDSEFIRAQVEMLRLVADWNIVEPTGSLETLAHAMLQKFPLRAGDAFQLAAAMEWCENKPIGRWFLTADHKLSKAADLSGFTLESDLVCS